MQKAWKILYKNHQIDRIAEISDRYDNKSQREKIFKKEEKQREREKERKYFSQYSLENFYVIVRYREKGVRTVERRTRDDIICGISV